MTASRARLAAFRTIVATEQAFRAAGIEIGVDRLAPDVKPSPPRGSDRSDREPPPLSPEVEAFLAIGRDPTRSARTAQWLAALIDDLRPDIVHSGPLIQCGPLAYAARSLCREPFPRWLVSNWGSDLQHTVRHPAYRDAAETILAHADFYFAECERDVRLARLHRFAGVAGTPLPIGGGMDLASMAALRNPGPTSARRVLMLKGYQGEIGRAFVGLEAIRRCADLLKEYEILVYGATGEVALAAQVLEADARLSLTSYPPGSRTYEDVLRDHGRARVSIGLSLTDGLSTWAVEAMAMGSFPVQSKTACLDEWTGPDSSALYVHPEQPDEVAATLRRALTDDELVDRAARRNSDIIRRRFERATVVPQLLAMYEHFAAAPRPAAREDARPALSGHAGPPRPSPGGGIVLNSIPKSGSHMLASVILEATGARGWLSMFEGWPSQIEEQRAAIEAAEDRPPHVKAHVYHSPQWNDLRVELGLRMLFLYRDPRDTVVSYVHWLMGPDQGLGGIQKYIRDVLGDHQARMRAMISGFSFEGYDQPDIGTFVGRFVPWIDEPGVCLVSFEEIVAPDTRDAALRRVYRFVCPEAEFAPLDEALVERLRSAMAPERSITFRSGLVGSWRTEFDDDTFALFNEVAGDVTSRLGYAGS